MTSCSQPETRFSHAFPESACWNLADTLRFPVAAEAVPLELELVFLPDYAYRNVHLQIFFDNQPPILLTDTVLDAEGNWLGEASRGRFVHRFSQTVAIPAESQQIRLVQFMRDSSLCQIEEVRVY
jgi:hypothetical protein